MPRPTADHYELSETDKRDLIKLIEDGKPLPERYRFLLFEDKREVELVWNGKTREVCTAVLPFQTLEHIDEPRKETERGLQSATQMDLLDTTGRQIKGWANKLIWGDNKLILSSLKAGAIRRQLEDAGGLKLIYIDPPFDVGADFSMDIEIGGETFHKEPNLLEQIAYRDTWGRGADSFLSMVYERMILMRDLMHPEGSIYVHMGPAVNHLVRGVLDEVFGGANALREIIWKRVSSRSHGDYYPATHDYILFYSKTDSPIWNQLYEPLDASYVESKYRFKDPDGRVYRKDNCLNQNKNRPNLTYDWNGHIRTWRWTKDKMTDLESEGRLIYTKSGIPEYKRYLDESAGVALQSVWADINPVNSQAKEDTQYPTQKPTPLLERIIKASSNEGDLVADFFCGSGTTAAVAEKLGRKWIATDLGKFGIHTTRKRLIQVQRELKKEGRDFRAFEVLNLGRYERQAYLNVSPRLSGKKKAEALARKEQEFRDLILRAYKAQPLGGGSFVEPRMDTHEHGLRKQKSSSSSDIRVHPRSSVVPSSDSFFHGKLSGRLVVIGPINLPVGRLFVEEVITECRKRGASRADILAFEFEMGLFPAVLAEAQGKGIDIAPKIIPPEVFDKRAVDKGQARFAEVAYVEATPRYDKKDKLTLALELTDFSVHYSQGIADELAENLKAGKSEVVCDFGKLYKLSKDKKGIVTREALTKHWTDWVDYWAVDFDYESRREIIQQPKTMGVEGELPGVVHADQGEFIDFEERWTGAYIFENEWQSFRTRKDRELELTTAPHTYAKPGRYTVALIPVNVG